MSQGDMTFLYWTIYMRARSEKTVWAVITSATSIGNNHRHKQVKWRPCAFYVFYWSESAGLVTQRRHYTTDVTCCDALSSSSVVSGAFSVPCVYAKFGHHQ